MLVSYLFRWPPLQLWEHEVHLPFVHVGLWVVRVFSKVKIRLRKWKLFQTCYCWRRWSSWTLIFIAQTSSFWFDRITMNIFNRMIFEYTVNWSLWKSYNYNKVNIYEFDLPILSSTTTCLRAFAPLANFPLWAFVCVTLFDSSWFFIVWTFGSITFSAIDLAFNLSLSISTRTAFWTVTPITGYPFWFLFYLEV